MQLEQKKEINEFQEKHTLILLSGFCWQVQSLEQTRTNRDKEPDIKIRENI